MLGELFVKLNKVLSQNRLSFFLGLSLLLGVLGWGMTRLRVTESIFETLPKGQAFQEFNQLVQTKHFINQIVFSLEWEPNSDLYEAEALLTELADSLSQCTLLANIRTTRPEAQESVYNFTQTNFPLLIDSAYYSGIVDKIQEDTVYNALQGVKNQLLAPGGDFVKTFMINDPLGIGASYYQALNKTNNSGQVIVEDGVMLTADRRQILLTATTAYESGNSQQDLVLHQYLQEFSKNWKANHPQHTLSYFGTFEISARNASQVKTDTTVTAILSVILILILLFGYYRIRSIPLLLTLPGIFGAMFALGVIGFIKPNISGISLATGAVIFGILLDYAIHFFTHYRHERSIPQVLRDISAPLLTGSFTTLMAFGALLFANSIVLQDFGLFAALGLFGAALFTLIVLPIVVSVVDIDWPERKQATQPLWLPKLRPVPTLGLLFLGTLFFLYHARHIEFDGHFDNLSIQDADLQVRENQLTGLNPEKEKRIYLFATSSDPQQAAEANYRAYRRLSALKDSAIISSFLSAGAFMIPDSIQNRRAQRWNNFWNSARKEQLFRQIDRSSSQVGFQAEAFQDFKNWIDKPATRIQHDSILVQLGLDNLVDKQAGKTTYITPIVVENQNLPFIKQELRNLAGVTVFDRAELAEDLVAMVKDDFNYLLALSASIVFITLLLVYGRIELALLTFFPMVISWIWILGIASLLHIPFNFVNVVVTTFIFGLGDDFSIFVTDGLLQKYHHRRNSLQSYKSAIWLSGFTTLIGTGCLILAKHPAIHSIALISMLGIGCILFMSFIVQPALFRLFVQDRIEKKKPPITFLPFLISVNSFCYFVVGCLILHSHLVTILLLPISKKKKRRLMNQALSFYAKTVIYSGPHVRKNLEGLQEIDPQRPVLFIANHSSFLDILLTIMINPRLVLMVKGWVYKSPFFGPIIRYAGYLYSDNGPEKNLQQARALIEDGYSILIFPEGTRSSNGAMGRFHKGAFHLATELNIPIQPILIHGASEVLPKNDFLIRSGTLNVKVLPPIHLQESQWGSSLRDKTKNASQFFKEAHQLYAQEKETTTYLKPRIFSNYVFKGPVLEWYFKVKWKLEEKNFSYYNSLIGDRRQILDIGCGYGYLSFYLHYKDPTRTILGLDYDAGKISTALNAYNKTDQLQFAEADIMHFDLGQRDVIFLNDVLHYLSADKQRILLERCHQALSLDGLLIIRDGITDQADRHKNTSRTEQLSTGLFGFNKKSDEFHFFHSQVIKDFASSHGMAASMEAHSKTTSNVLFVLKRTSY
ncbi:1-acyl-sn-glycerol-3-phosphate acyltransferase [Dyadobacter jejuensis]|uniref:1-acyl-sn-glycerol-3-phosphate acyltransferase n=1 Tax=Dyadobacter jejuensis TaxID=1082580 RepID=A0A316ALB1_9BACT|nr:trifunctional MMPL family transporter/lysophospholipid acyltransferase/class I SAM-dependent methyltransferase [Dyadobacter jejuensis]PWJ58553.1 1-acyl-sn-glycerol-3-phosphate acyltransferase [Dyadobacter jejuensis]